MTRRGLSEGTLALLAGAAAGLLLGGAMMYVAWRHNPQGEFHEAGRVHWDAWLAVGLPWFALPFVLGLIVFAGLRLEQRRPHR